MYMYIFSHYISTTIAINLAPDLYGLYATNNGGGEGIGFVSVPHLPVRWSPFAYGPFALTVVRPTYRSP